MFDGYYTHSSVPGVIHPPKVMHSMMDLLPPMSLLEVNKSEVRTDVCVCVSVHLFNSDNNLIWFFISFFKVQDSYHHPTLKR